nr:hypothetical protein CFP56_50826 [Quercus suber]
MLAEGEASCPQVRSKGQRRMLHQGIETFTMLITSDVAFLEDVRRYSWLALCADLLLRVTNQDMGVQSAMQENGYATRRPRYLPRPCIG